MIGGQGLGGSHDKAAYPGKLVALIGVHVRANKHADTYRALRQKGDTYVLH